jgi:DNA-binding winged helix-turn-helix (wHTH) protein
VAISFGPFALDEATGELTKDGARVPLEPQPARVLALLARHVGEVVPRDRLIAGVCGTSTHVDYQLGLNYCVRRIRVALGDSADRPTFLETLPRRGYRLRGAATRPIPVTRAAPPQPQAEISRIRAVGHGQVARILKWTGRLTALAASTMGWTVVAVFVWFTGLHFLCPARPAAGPSPHHDAAVEALHTLWRVGTSAF